MSNKNKLQKFAELATFGNAFQNFTPQAPELKNNLGETVDFKGQWNTKYFQRDAPIVLELACGKAEYTVYMAQHLPERNYFAVDIKGNRIWKGAKYAWENELTNAGFLRTHIEKLPSFLGPNEVSEVWIIFPDPQPRKAKARKRLTSPMFLNYYRQFMKPDGIVNLKTDADSLFEYTLEVIAEQKLPIIRQVNDVYKECPDDPLLTVQTFYEKMHLEEGRTIKFVSFRLNPES